MLAGSIKSEVLQTGDHRSPSFVRDFYLLRLFLVNLNLFDSETCLNVLEVKNCRSNSSRCWTKAQTSITLCIVFVYF